MTKVVLLWLASVLISVYASHLPRGGFAAPEGTPTVKVNTKFGSIEGFKVDKKDKFSANIFVGVPYAAPPIGERKLEKPEPVIAWKDTLKALKWPLPCAPHCSTVTKWIGDVSENCLYLNIFAPSAPPPPGGYPVAVWLHGGGFCFGDTEYYGYEGLAENFVSKGIIVVSVQYRLGPFGFFSTGDHVAPGNLGLWDQRQALLFLRDVLKDFGGDKERITVFGHSAGGCSTSLLSASPHSRDLFAQSYQLSGSAFVEWGNSQRVVGVSKELAKHLECPPTSCSQTLKDCIKSKSTDEILQASDKFGLSRNDLNFDWYHPYAQNEWFSKDYVHELKDTKPKPTLIGITSAESYLSSAYVPESLATMFSIHMGYTKDQQEHYKKEDLIKFIREFVATYSAFGKHADEAAKEIIDFYTGNATPEDLKYKRFYFARYTQLLSDIQFTVPTARDALEKAKLGWPTYVYLFDWTNPDLAESYGFYDGANHGFELAYLHGTFIFLDFEFTKRDHEIKKIFVDGVANFIKTGNPSGEDEKWPALPKDPEHDFPYFHMSEKHGVANNFFASKLDFWHKFNDKYHFDLIRGEYKHSKKTKDEL
uniref:Carboxylic ester hydrolase n=1 Tax=Panagrellus redivivus TaxID=6233 RepID=A0A7E4VAI2_PANRE